MSEDAEMYRAIKEEKQKRHAEWWIKNTRILKSSSLVFKEASHECYIFRELGKPKVDFYPSTGRWRNIDTGKTHSGGATLFIQWYKSLKIKP